MHEKTLAIITIDVEEGNPTVNFIKENLEESHRLQTRNVQLHTAQTEIKRSLQLHDITILICDYTDNIAKALSDIFHQELVDITFGKVPRYARFLDTPVDTLLYVQGLIVIPNCNINKSVLTKFLSNGLYNDNTIDKVYDFTRYEHVRKSIESIEICFTQYQPNSVFISFNGGKDCTVLLHLTLAVLKKNYPQHLKLLCLYIQNSDSFDEIDKFVDKCQKYYNLDVVKLTKNTKESLTEILQDNRCLKACLMGTRRTDPFSENLETFQMTDCDWPQVMRVSPLLDWHYSQIWDYLLTLDVPYCELYDLGYTSMGSVVNTSKNPALRHDDGYLPAYKLLDASLERLGRTGCSDQTHIKS